MQKRYVAIWFPFLKTDWHTRRKPFLAGLPVVLALPKHGRMVISAANKMAASGGAVGGMAVADARAIIPSLVVLDDHSLLDQKLLKALAIWCIRFSPVIAFDLPDGIIIDATGCAHLWGGESSYLQFIQNKMEERGYAIQLAMADTISAAWAASRFDNGRIIEPGKQAVVLSGYGPAALRLDDPMLEKCSKLGLHSIGQFISMPSATLRRRFDANLIKRLQQALGSEPELIQPVITPALFQEWLPCVEPIVTAVGIEIALKQLLGLLCSKLQREEKGLRKAIFKGYRVDGKIQSISIGTNRPNHREEHLYKLFEDKIATIEPDLGIELFVLEAPVVESLKTIQAGLWQQESGLEDNDLAELLDRVSQKFGEQVMHRYLPAAHYWPERSYKAAQSLTEASTEVWKLDRPRPICLLPEPEKIEVSAPLPDYPPMLFRYRNILHRIVAADGPERIEAEWWLQEGDHRDYYCVEDETGNRYWLFRLGHYKADQTHRWFLHGFFA